MSPPRSYLVPAELFRPPSGSTPDSLFKCSSGWNGDREWGLPDSLYHRVTRVNHITRWDPEQILLYTDAACPSNGQPDATGGCGVVWHDPIPGKPNAGILSFRLEDYDPFGKKHHPTNNRAELRAAIAALQLCDWPYTRIKKIVIATVSEHVVKGATEFCSAWLQNGWKKSEGGPVLNQDLWTALLQLVTEFKYRGVTVYFWHIRRELNKDAKWQARQGAKLPAHARYELRPVVEERWDADRAVDRAAIVAAVNKRAGRAAVDEAVVDDLTFNKAVEEAVAYMVEDGEPLGYLLQGMAQKAR